MRNAKVTIRPQFNLRKLRFRVLFDIEVPNINYHSMENELVLSGVFPNTTFNEQPNILCIYEVIGEESPPS